MSRSLYKSIFRAAFTVTLLVFVAACGDNQPPAAAPPTAAVAATPDAAIRKWIELLKQGDIAGLLQNAMPPAVFEQFKADWAREHNEKPITDADRQKFAETMNELTAPDAEQKLYAQIEPQLKQFDAQYQQQIPMYVAMGTSWMQSTIQQNKELSDVDKQQAMTVVNALGAWAQKTRFTDPDLVKQVLAILVKAARDMNLKTLDEVHALSFEQSIQKARIAYLAVRDALNVYGLSIDQVLDSVKPEVIANDGKAAKVKISYALLGAPISVEASQMMNIDGRWYSKDIVDAYKKTAADTTQAPSTPPPGAAPATDSAAKKN
ncbi:MAG: hypothetical protein LBQ20_13070 [Rhodanobacter sp.]|jgi:hypothetical protein|nr:hypothetical protein [Rhodanobacter sp.]